MNTRQTANRQSNTGPHLSEETLSDLASGRLDEPARLAALRHADTCAACTQAVRDYAAMTSLLRGLPSPRPARNFQLSAEQARSQRRSGWRFPSLTPSLPALRAAALAVAMLLLIVAGADRLTRPSGDSSKPAQMSAMAAPTETSIAPQPAILAPTVAAPTSFPAAAGAVPSDDANQSMSAASESSSGAPAAVGQAPAPRPTPAGGFNGSAADASLASPGNEAPAAASAYARAVGATPAASPQLEATPDPTQAAVSASAAPTQPPTAPTNAAAASDGGASRTGWRVIELGLALLLVWLIVSYAGARRTARRGR